jgi:hypothetical protein
MPPSFEIDGSDTYSDLISHNLPIQLERVLSPVIAPSRQLISPVLILVSVRFFSESAWISELYTRPNVTI